MSHHPSIAILVSNVRHSRRVYMESVFQNPPHPELPFRRGAYENARDELARIWGMTAATRVAYRREDTTRRSTRAERKERSKVNRRRARAARLDSWLRPALPDWW